MHRKSPILCDMPITRINVLIFIPALSHAAAKSFNARWRPDSVEDSLILAYSLILNLTGIASMGQVLSRIFIKTEVVRQSKFKIYTLNSLKLIKGLGSGSFGIVQLYFHEELKQLLVVKSFTISGDEKYKKKLIADAKREAKIHARFNHKNIVKVLGITEREERKFRIILEYIPYGNLRKFLDAGH